MTVGKGGVRGYEGHEVKWTVALVRVPFYFIDLHPTVTDSFIFLKFTSDRYRQSFCALHYYSGVNVCVSGETEACACVCVCVCVRERERAREQEWMSVRVRRQRRHREGGRDGERTGLNVSVSGETGVRSLRWRDAQLVAQLTVMIGTIFFLFLQHFQRFYSNVCQ